MTNDKNRAPAPAPTLTEAERIESRRAQLATEQKRLEVLQRGEDLGGYKGVVHAIFEKLIVIARHNANPYKHPGGDAKEWAEVADLIELGLAIEDASSSSKS